VTDVIILPAAAADLDDIWWTIAVDDPLTATRIVRAIGDKISNLAQHPRRGPRRADIQPGMRMLVEGPYLILYKTRPDADDGPVDEVSIVRVVDGRRDLSNLG
jgi:toxin ParE1/3/4